MTHAMVPRAVGAALVIAVAAHAPAYAQAVCSAPHSSPTITQSESGISIHPFGSGIVQVTAYHSESTTWFGPDSRSTALPLAGNAVTTSLYVTTVAGIGQGMEVWVQLPVHRVRYRDNTRDDSRIAVGDPRLSFRIGGELVGLDALPIAVRAGLKLPGSEFPVDPGLIPVSDGQTDFEVAVEAAHVLAGAYPLQLSGWAGYRWRLTDDEQRRKPGDERFARLDVGGPVGAAGSRLRWQLAAEGLWGKPFESGGIAPANSRRTLVQVLPSLGWRLVDSGAELQLTGRFSLAGRNLPSGPAVSAGFMLPWAL